MSHFVPAFCRLSRGSDAPKVPEDAVKAACHSSSREYRRWFLGKLTTP